ncbi:MAG: hypothetical protein IJT39_03420 [Bacteroidales bacterium]|nr:hypothetical protein [Bacteroidales bacterium]
MQRCSQPSALAALLVLQVYFHQVGVVVLRRLRQALLGLQLLHRVEVGENGQLFGAINNIQVADALKAQYNYDVDRKKNLPNLKDFLIPSFPSDKPLSVRQ